MNAKPYFLDTNILVYGYTGQDNAKSSIANGLILGGQALVSAQVLAVNKHQIKPGGNVNASSHFVGQPPRPTPLRPQTAQRYQRKQTAH